MTKSILISGNDLYLSKRYLKGYTSSKSIERWYSCSDIIKLKVDGECYFLYPSLPFRTRKKLLSKDKIIHQESKQAEKTSISETIKNVFYFQHSNYRTIYEADSNLTSIKITEFAKLHAVLQCIIDLKANEGLRDLKAVYDCFNNLFPNKYSSKHALSNALRKARADGVMTVAMDKRVFGNNNDQTKTKTNPVHAFWISSLVSHSRKFSYPEIHKKITALCAEHGYAAPSLSWVKQNGRKQLKNFVLFEGRYGQAEINKKSPFTSLHNAKFANDAWQMDGWTLPFWVHADKPFQRYTLVRLIDTNSKKIVGYSVGKSENTLLIMDAIRDAINKTGVLPFEIITDNHAFNQTRESANLQRLLAKKGARWTVTQNPQYKAVVERYNQHLDAILKNKYDGYLGQNVRAKSINALAKPEMVDQYLKNQLSDAEIKARATALVLSYNTTIQKEGKTPDQLYIENTNPSSITINHFDQAELLTLQTEKLIRRGQITFSKGLAKHEFQLPTSALIAKWNDTVVKVCYEDFNEGIYIFDKNTDEPIAFIHPKCKINGTKINQTDADILNLNKQAALMKGIKNQAKVELREIYNKAHAILPDAYARVNAITTPKDLIKELQEDSNLRRHIEAKGIDINSLTVPNRNYSGIANALQPEKKDHSPFSAKGNVIKIIDPKNSLNEEDMS